MTLLYNPRILLVIWASKKKNSGSRIRSIYLLLGLYYVWSFPFFSSPLTLKMIPLYWLPILSSPRTMFVVSNNNSNKKKWIDRFCLFLRGHQHIVLIIFVWTMGKANWMVRIANEPVWRYFEVFFSFCYLRGRQMPQWIKPIWN